MTSWLSAAANGISAVAASAATYVGTVASSVVTSGGNNNNTSVSAGGTAPYNNNNSGSNSTVMSGTRGSFGADPHSSSASSSFISSPASSAGSTVASASGFTDMGDLMSLEMTIHDSYSGSHLFFPLAFSPFLRRHHASTGETSYKLHHFTIPRVAKLLTLLTQPAGSSASAAAAAAAAASGGDIMALPDNNSFGSTATTCTIPRCVDSATLKQLLRVELDAAYNAPGEQAPLTVKALSEVAGVAFLFQVELFSDAYATVMRERIRPAMHPVPTSASSNSLSQMMASSSPSFHPQYSPSSPMQREESVVAAPPLLTSPTAQQQPTMQLPSQRAPPQQQQQQHLHHHQALYDMLRLPPRADPRELRRAADRARFALHIAVYATAPPKSKPRISQEEWDGTYKLLFPVGMAGAVSEVHQGTNEPLSSIVAAANAGAATTSAAGGENSESYSSGSNNSNSNNRSEPLSRPRWERDEDVSVCPRCKNSFQMLPPSRMRSHCRCCGRIWCKGCLAMPDRVVEREVCAFPKEDSPMQKACGDCFAKMGAGRPVRFVQDLIERCGFSIPEVHILALIDETWCDAATRVLRHYRESIHLGRPNPRHDQMILATAPYAAQHPQLLLRIARLNQLWDPTHPNYDQYLATAVADQIVGVVMGNSEPRPIFSHSQLACTRACSLSLTDRGTFAIQILAALNQVPAETMSTSSSSSAAAAAAAAATAVPALSVDGSSSNTGDASAALTASASGSAIVQNEPVIKIRKAVQLALVGEESVSAGGAGPIPDGIPSSRRRSFASGGHHNNSNSFFNPAGASSNSSPSSAADVIGSPSSGQDSAEPFVPPLVTAAPHSRVAVWLFALTDLLVERGHDMHSYYTIVNIVRMTVQNERGLQLRTFCEILCRQTDVGFINRDNFLSIVTRGADQRDYEELNQLKAFLAILASVSAQPPTTTAEARAVVQTRLTDDFNAPNLRSPTVPPPSGTVAQQQHQHQQGDINTLLSDLPGMHRLLPMVLYPFEYSGNTQITAVDVNGIEIMQSNSKPIRIPLVVRQRDKPQTERRVSILLKHENMWNDHLARQFALLLFDALDAHLDTSSRRRYGGSTSSSSRSSGSDPSMSQLRSVMYSVLPLDTTCGIVEMLPSNVAPLEKLLSSKKDPNNPAAPPRAVSLQEYLADASPSPTDFRRKIFTRSVQFSILLTHVLGICDRHLSNLMLNVQTLAMCDIDYGHIFGSRTLVEEIQLFFDSYSRTAGEEVTCARFDPMIADAVVDMLMPAPEEIRRILNAPSTATPSMATATAAGAAAAAAGGPPSAEEQQRRLQNLREKVLNEFIDETARMLFGAVRPWMDVISLLLMRHKKHFEEQSRRSSMAAGGSTTSTAVAAAAAVAARASHAGGAAAGAPKAADKDLITAHFFHCFALNKKDADAIESFKTELKKSRSRRLQDLAHTAGQKGAMGLLSAATSKIWSYVPTFGIAGSSAGQ